MVLVLAALVFSAFQIMDAYPLVIRCTVEVSGKHFVFYFDFRICVKGAYVRLEEI